jgi:hypothetical protein
MARERTHGRLVVQVNRLTAETNINFLLDPEDRVEDCLITAGAWADAAPLVGEVTVEAARPLLALLASRTFRAEDNPDELDTTEVELWDDVAGLSSVTERTA